MTFRCTILAQADENRISFEVIVKLVRTFLHQQKEKKVLPYGT